MAAAVEAHWAADRELSGMVVTRHEHGVPGLRRIAVVEAAHPVPDRLGHEAARAMLAAVSGLGPSDLVLGLFSGGGSALLALPAAGITLADKQAVTRALLRSGAGIGDVNCVRRHLSAIKGGRLALAAYPAAVVSLLVSDVPGDDPAAIASGPTVPDPTTLEDARRVLAAFAIDMPARVRDSMVETPKPGDAGFARVRHILVATPQASLLAAAELAKREGVRPVVLGDAIEGEAREVARAMAGMALACARHGEPAAAPCVLISGGETSVTVRGAGRGGRNTEFLLALAVALGGHKQVWALAADTDGIDGTEDNAGAIVRPDTLARGADARASLAENDAYGFFAALGDLIITKPTQTNVGDFRAIFVAGANS